MAPTVPKLSIGEHRMARLRGDIHPHAPYKVHRKETTVSDSFASSKKDKRVIKKSAFVSRIAKANAKPSRNTTRRANKKLNITLTSLADALPNLTGDAEMDDSAAAAAGKIRHKSLKSRPGALKRKEVVVKSEMSRFGANMAQLATVSEAAPKINTPAPAKLSRKQQKLQSHQQSQAPAPVPVPQMETSTTNRWAALRGFISATMEQNPAFVNKS
ncbi:hypothetical protein Cpir12675_002165 [Ceratocystis pirilliformis]|uniref:Ribosome biogenesis protein SLX9 n=1 Tax=Ceratocystis pirilliformis TaxID=259994 RepID=A0ABR3ZAX7_9PEZI